MSVQLHIFGTRFSLAGMLRKVLREVGVGRGIWTVKVVGDEEMIDMHGRTMGIWTTTDVLTFDMRETGGNLKSQISNSKTVELDTVVCVDEARRRAREMGHGRGGVREELLLYCVHSLLHVQGYNDVTEAGARRMHAREDEILTAIGVGGGVRGKNPKSEIRNPKVGRRA